MMQSSLCIALLTTAAALQAPMTRTQQRRVVANRAPMDLNGPTSTALCAADDDGYEAPKIEFDPDADGARAASDRALPFGHGEPTQGCESAPSFGRSPRRRRALNPIYFFSNAVGGRDLWSDRKNGIYIGSVAIGVLLPLFFFVVRP
jgi:hypothetical protein